jgi:hypothetical protein
MVCGNMQVDVLQSVVRPVPRIQVDDLDTNAHVRVSPSFYALKPETANAASCFLLERHGW